MDSLIRILTTLAIVAVMYGIWMVIAKACDRIGKRKADREALKTLSVGAICVLLFGTAIVLMSIFPNDTAYWWVYVIFGIFVLLGLILILISISALSVKRTRKK